MRIDARLQILYLVAVGVVAFSTARPAWLLGLLGLQLALWLGLRLPGLAMFRAIRKLYVFFAVLVISCGFFAPESGDRMWPLSLLGWDLEVNLTGIARGLLLSTRIVTVILASQIVQRTGDGTAIVRGLRGLLVPSMIAYALDMVLTLIGGTARPGSGQGQGGDGGRRRHAADDDHEEAPYGWKTSDVMRRAIRGDVGFLVEMIQRSIARARERAEGYGLKPEVVTDLAVIAGLAVVAMTFRALHVLPNIPFAPGHKGALNLPLYILAHALTTSRWGASRLGVVIGVVSFLTGEGKFGVFEILRHITPGLFVDLVTPLVRRMRGGEPGALAYALIGVGAAWTRLSTLLVVAYLVEVPAVFYAFLIPQIVSNAIFGFLSGFVTLHLMKSVQKLRAAL